MSRHLDILAIPLLLAVGAAASCVTTEQRSGGPGAPGPDPRRPQAQEASPETQAAPRAGMRVVTLPDAADPVVGLRVMFLSGSRDDPPGKEGLTALSARLMAEATRSLSAAELDRALFPWAAELDVVTEKETTVFTGRVHRDHAERFLPIFLDTLRAPRLAPSDFERLKAQQKSHLVDFLRSGSDEALQREALEVTLFDHVGHPYRHTPAGTVEGLEAITLGDVKAHIERVFTQDRLVVGVVGAVPPKLVTYLERELEALSATSPERPALPELPRRERTTALLIDKPTAGSAISVGHLLDVERGEPDYVALKVAETYLGEHREFIGRLFQRMREARGLNYGDYAYVEHFREAPGSKLEQLNIPRRQQYFSLWIRPVEHRNRHFALRQAVYELRRLIEEGIPDDESFEQARRFLASQWVRKEQEPLRRLGYRLDDAFYGSDREAMKEALMKLTREEVNAAIRRHLRGDRLSIVVVTSGAEAFANELVAGAPSPITYSADKPAAILEEDARIQAVDLGLAPGAVRVVTPGALFER